MVPKKRNSPRKDCPDTVKGQHDQGIKCDSNLGTEIRDADIIAFVLPWFLSGISIGSNVVGMTRCGWEGLVVLAGQKNDSPEEIVRLLQRIDEVLAQGGTVELACREIGASTPTYYK